MKLDTKTLIKTLQAIAVTQPHEINCSECHEEIDSFVEMLRAGKDPAEIKPLVQHHLDICECCREEFEALIKALEAQDAAFSEEG
jgi:adenosine deaminase